MNPWDAEATRLAIQRVYGREQLELARPCIRSLSDRQFHAQYHYQRAEQTLKRYVRVHLKSKEFISILLGAGSQEWDRFNIVIRKIGADLTACIQSLHETRGGSNLALNLAPFCRKNGLGQINSHDDNPDDFPLLKC